LKGQGPNFARGLKVRDRIPNKKCKTGQNDQTGHMPHLGFVTF